MKSAHRAARGIKCSPDSVGGPVTDGTAGSQPGQQFGDAAAKTNADIGSIGPAPGSGGSPAVAPSSG